MSLKEKIKKIVDQLNEEKLKELFQLLIHWIR